MQHLSNIDLWVYDSLIGGAENFDRFNLSEDFPDIPDEIMGDPNLLGPVLLSWWRAFRPANIDLLDDASRIQKLLYLVALLDDPAGIILDDDLKEFAEGWWQLPVGHLSSREVERRSQSYLILPSGFEPDRSSPEGVRLDHIREWTPGDRIE